MKGFFYRIENTCVTWASVRYHKYYLEGKLLQTNFELEKKPPGIFWFHQDPRKVGLV